MRTDSDNCLFEWNVSGALIQGQIKDEVRLGFSTGGQGSCPYHKRVLVKWEIRGDYRYKVKGKHMIIDVDPQSGMGRIECRALSEDGSRCQMDLEPCPVNQIIEYFVRGKPVRSKY